MRSARFRGWLARQWEEHSLGLISIAVWWATLGLSLALYDGSLPDWGSERAGGHSDDAFGAVLLIWLSKWLYEWGSAASNPNPKEVPDDRPEVSREPGQPAHDH